MARNGFKVMDSDMHVLEPPDLWQRYIDSEFKEIAPLGLTSNNVSDLRVVHPEDGRLWGHRPPNHTRNVSRGHNFDRTQNAYRHYSEMGWSAEAQLEGMDVEGVDIAVLYPTRGLLVFAEPHMEPRFAAAIARAYNDWLHDFCSTDPKRLLGAGMISPFSIEDAVSEARRCVEELGFRAIFVRANVVNDHNWHDSYYEPLWDTLEMLRVPLGFHEASGSGWQQVGEKFDPNFMLRRTFAQPVEQMLALAAMCGGGVLARHPKLKVAFLEANSTWLPWLLWRLDEAWEREGDVYTPDVTRAPSEYFKRQCYTSIEPDEEAVRDVIQRLGNDFIVFSTDYPHSDSKFPHAVETFLELPLTDEEKRKILWDNCVSLYDMGDQASGDTAGVASPG